MGIADFIIDRMSRYIAGGLPYGKVAHFTRGELLAIYEGNHYSRDKSGAMAHTPPPPEPLDTETAMTKADAVFTELLNNHISDTEQPRTDGRASNPQNTPVKTKKTNGLEGLKNYVNRKPA